jgi:hypothetical protein
MGIQKEASSKMLSLTTRPSTSKINQNVKSTFTASSSSQNRVENRFKIIRGDYDLQ